MQHEYDGQALLMYTWELYTCQLYIGRTKGVYDVQIS